MELNESFETLLKWQPGNEPRLTTVPNGAEGNEPKDNFGFSELLHNCRPKIRRYISRMEKSPSARQF